MRPHKHVWSDKLAGPVEVLGPHFCLTECWRYSSRPAPPLPFPTFLSQLLLSSFCTDSESPQMSNEGQPASALPPAGMDGDPCCFAGCLPTLSSGEQSWALGSRQSGLGTPAGCRAALHSCCSKQTQTQPGKFLTLGL